MDPVVKNMDTNNNQQEKGIISIKRNSDQLDSANHANQAGPTSDVVQCVLFPTCRKTFKGMSYMWQHAHYRHGIDQHAYETMVERRDTNFTQSTSTQALLEQVQKEQEIHFGQEKKVTQHPPTHGEELFQRVQSAKSVFQHLAGNFMLHCIKILLMTEDNSEEIKLRHLKQYAIILL